MKRSWRGSWLVVVVGVTLQVVHLATAAERSVDPKTDATRVLEDRLRKDLEFLASDQCEGRGVSTKGINLAADHVAAEFKRAGLTPAGSADSYFQPFSMTGAAVVGKPNSLLLHGPNGQDTTPTLGEDFQVLGLSGSGSVDAGIVFAGFGISSKEAKYDDYQGLDVAGKIVIVLRKTPRADNTATPFAGDRAAHYAALTTKLVNAEEHKPAAVLFVNDRGSGGATDSLMEFAYTASGSSPTALPAFHVHRTVVDALLARKADKNEKAEKADTLDDLETAINGDLTPRGKVLSGWTAKLTANVVRPKLSVKNVVGTLEGRGDLAKEALVIGAHYDHLGYGGQFSLAPDKTRAIHYGADDNASGTTALIELARRFGQGPQPKDRRRLVFIAFSGEESGLLGSEHYCQKPLFPLAETVAMVNMDMVGRLRPETIDAKAKNPPPLKDRLIISGTGTAKGFDMLVDELNRTADFRIKKEPGGIGPSDHSSFYLRKIPVFFFFTGEHTDYHRPSDTADKINFTGMVKVISLVEDLAKRLATEAERPSYVEVKEAKTTRPEGSMPRIGIMPNYGDEQEGVLLSGVKTKSPADKAGLKQGDRIVEISGKVVKNLEAYMVQMMGQKKGTPIELGVLRDGKKITVQVQPE